MSIASVITEGVGPGGTIPGLLTGGFFFPSAPSTGAGVARVGDTISHGGHIISGSTNRLANGLGIARLGDAVHCDTHGDVVITSASTKAKANGLGIARVGDSVSCGATIISGSGNVKA
jgi:uncharacterized Zn-binding protein involved in type VI secretion